MSGFAIFAILFLVSIFLVYLLIVRPLLKSQPVLSATFKAEAAFADKVRAKVVGWRTRIAARLMMVASMIVGLYDQVLPAVSGTDWSPLTVKIPSWALPIGMFGTAMLFAYLRKISDNAPQLVTATDDDGVKKVVAVVKPGAA